MALLLAYLMRSSDAVHLLELAGKACSACM